MKILLSIFMLFALVILTSAQNEVSVFGGFRTSNNLGFENPSPRAGFDAQFRKDKFAAIERVIIGRDNKIGLKGFLFSSTTQARYFAVGDIFLSGGAQVGHLTSNQRGHGKTVFHPTAGVGFARDGLLVESFYQFRDPLSINHPSGVVIRGEARQPLGKRYGLKVQVQATATRYKDDFLRHHWGVSVDTLAGIYWQF